MTKEEAKLQMHEAFEEEYLRGYKQGFKDRAKQSDLEHKTCESCRYAIKRGFVDKICDNESGIAYDVVVKTTDGCNKWETK